MRGVLAYVALGANLGDRLGTLREAARRIDATPGLEVLRASSPYDTAPLGPPQPRYLNAVLELDACLTPHAHLRALLSIEASLGRVRAERYGPRTIDLDLLWQGGLALTNETLELPHPRLTERAFVLAPLAELSAGLIIRGETIAAHLARLPEHDRAEVHPQSEAIFSPTAARKR